MMINSVFSSTDRKSLDYQHYQAQMSAIVEANKLYVPRNCIIN